MEQVCKVLSIRDQMRPISRSEKQKNLVERTLRGFVVPGAGIEPARIAPLVFETSASTDSAIRA